MNFGNLAPGDALFVDANILTYHFEPHARWGPPCTHGTPCSANHRTASLALPHT